MFDHARKTIDDDSATPIARALLAAAENDTLVAPDHKMPDITTSANAPF